MSAYSRGNWACEMERLSFGIKFSINLVEQAPRSSWRLACVTNEWSYNSISSVNPASARDRLQYAVYKLQLDNVYYSSYSSKL